MSDNRTSTGVSTLGLLGVAFVVLKLTKVIDWNWWWVLAPFWGGFAIFIFALLIVLILKPFIKRYRRKKRNSQQFHEAKIVEETPRKKSKFQERLEEMRKQQMDQRKIDRERGIKY